MDPFDVLIPTITAAAAVVADRVWLYWRRLRSSLELWEHPDCDGDE